MPDSERTPSVPEPQLYTDLADWYELLTAPEDYAEEAAFYLRVFAGALGRLPTTLLELGSGAGHMASHYKRQIRQVMLTDRSPAMLALSARRNPDCTHVGGDMRSLRLGRTFDLVFAHDAIGYLTTEADLRQAVETAWLHCEPDGVVVLAPDHVRENFAEAQDLGGHDADGRSLRYLEWTWDPDPSDQTCVIDYACLLREEGQPMRCIHDRHVCGLFPRKLWLAVLAERGFDPISVRPLEHPEVPLGSVEIFVAHRPPASG